MTALTRAFSELRIAVGGTIAITGSGSSRVQVPTSETYNANKAALEMYTKTLRLEMQPLGCHVTYVMPGVVATAMFYDQAITFADDSPDQPVADKSTAGWKQKPVDVPQPVAEYARHVVEKVTQTISPKEV